MPSYSHSRISSFESCRLKYKYSYIDKIKTEREDTVETFLGSRVHETFEKLYKDLKFEKLNSLKELLAYYNKIWKENWHANVKINRKEYTQDNYKKIGVRSITDYYNRFKPFNQGRTIGIETEDKLKLDKEGKYRYHIRIDRLVDKGKGVYEVHDYKVSNSLPKQEYLDNDRQLAMYSLWVKQNFKDFKKVRLIWHYVSFDKDMQSVRTAQQLQDLRKEVVAKIKEIEKCKKFPPTVTRLCGWCGYQNICPMWKHEIELEEKTANEFLNDSGVKLVNKFVKAKTELKEFKDKIEEKLEQLEEALIIYAKKEGINVVIGSDNKVKITPYEKLSFPGKNTAEREKLITLLKDIRKLKEVSDLDIFALKKIYQEEQWSPELIRKLSKFVEKEGDYRLNVSKK